MSRVVFLAVLDWGLGHATRCIPIIRELLNQNSKVVVGGSGKSFLLLREEFRDEITLRELPSYEIVYGKNSLVGSILMQVPKICSRIRDEHKVSQHIIEQEGIDFIISDNRYGCYSRKIKSVFIGHQLSLQVPDKISFLSGAINKLHLNSIRNFDEVWVPDFKDSFRFSGILSYNSLLNTRYLGVLSRFGELKILGYENYEVVGLVSGPEPHRTLFEEILREQLHRYNGKSILIKGKPGHSEKTIQGNITEVDHLSALELETILTSASIIISRSGYSTIMDLAVLGKKVVFVPTPGQPEQEYLAGYLKDRNLGVRMDQDSFQIEEALEKIKSTEPLPKTEPNTGLKKAIESL